MVRAGFLVAHGIFECARRMFCQVGEEGRTCTTRIQPTPACQSDKRTEVCGGEFCWVLTCPHSCSHCVRMLTTRCLCQDRKESSREEGPGGKGNSSKEGPGGKESSSKEGPGGTCNDCNEACNEGQGETILGAWKFTPLRGQCVLSKPSSKQCNETIDCQRKREIVHGIDTVVESKTACGHVSFFTARDNSRCRHAYVAAGQNPKPNGLELQLVVRCPTTSRGQSDVHLLKASLQSSTGAMMPLLAVRFDRLLKKERPSGALQDHFQIQGVSSIILPPIKGH